MRKTPIDNNILEVMRSVHQDLPKLDEQSLSSIYDMLISEDSEIKLMGINMLEMSNYFYTPKTLYTLYNVVNISGDIDTDDTFATIIRLLYANSEFYDNNASKEDKEFDINLNQKLCKITEQEKQ